MRTRFISSFVIVVMMIAGITLIVIGAVKDPSLRSRNVLAELFESLVIHEENSGIEEGNRGIITITVRNAKGKTHTYSAALNESHNKVADTDREHCAAWYTYGDYVLIGDHNYQGFDILEQVSAPSSIDGSDRYSSDTVAQDDRYSSGTDAQDDRYSSDTDAQDGRYSGGTVAQDGTAGSNAILTITPPSESARDLNLPPGSTVDADSSDRNSSGAENQMVVSPVSGAEIAVDESGVSGDADKTTSDAARSLPGQSGEDEFEPIIKFPGRRARNYLADNNGRLLEEYVTETGAEIVTYTCRDNSQEDVWIVLWK